MNRKEFLTKWTIIGFLIGAAYFSHQTPAAQTEQAQPEQAGAMRAYRAARNEILETRKREQLEWQFNHPEEYYKIKNFKSHETIPHGAKRVPRVSRANPGNE